MRANNRAERQGSGGVVSSKVKGKSSGHLGVPKDCLQHNTSDVQQDR